MKKTEKELEAEKASLTSEMSGCSDLVRGSLFSRYLTCSRPGCKCHAGAKHGPVTCLSIVRDGRKRQQYVPRSLEPRASAAVAAYNRLLSIVDRLSEINLELLKMRSPGRAGARGRSQSAR